MAGNMYGPRGGYEEEIANRNLEKTIIDCLSNNVGKKFLEYGAYSENHSFNPTPSLLGTYRALPTRNITVRLGNPDNAYRIRYNTATKIHSVSKAGWSRIKLSDEDINNVLKCITTSLQEGGKRRRYRKQTKRTRRKNKTRKH